MITTFIIIVVLGIVAMFIEARLRYLKESKQKKTLCQEINNLPDFQSSEQIMGISEENGIIFDYDNKKACLIQREKKLLKYRIVKFRDILSTEMLEDGETLQKTVRSSQIGSALLGGLALGGLGAIIGGLSGKKNSVNKVHSIDVLIIIDDVNHPTHLVNCMSIYGGCEKKDSDYKEGVGKASFLQSKIEKIINQVDEEDIILSRQESNLSSHNFISDELKKLAELRDTGVLTENEFKEQKKKLLNH